MKCADNLSKIYFKFLLLILFLSCLVPWRDSRFSSLYPVRYQLFHANTKDSVTSREYFVWISDLTSDISEMELKKTFTSRYNSYKNSKIIVEQCPEKKIFGLVCFSDFNDQRDALIHMNGFQGLGEKPLKVSLSVPKQHLAASALQVSHGPYQTKSEEWMNSRSFQSNPVLVSTNANQFEMNGTFSFFGQENDENRIIDYNIPVNVDGLNAEYIARSEEVWDGVERDRWLYDFDEVGFVPNFKEIKSKIP